MSDSRSLYEQTILDHNRNPRNFGKLGNADKAVDGVNPLCGDAFTIYVKFDGDLIADARFHGSGCAISKASASLMTSLLKGKTRGEAQALYERFHDMLHADVDAPIDEEGLGKLKVFSGVREYPMRIKCATLAWHALNACLAEEPTKPQGVFLSSE